MTIALLDHLWQSTLFAGVLALATLLFRNNGAGIRHGLWFAASMKFLVPFALLTAAAQAVLVPVHSAAKFSHLLCDAQPVTEPFLTRAQAAAPHPLAGAFPLAFILVVLWALGFAAVAIDRAVRWSSLRRTLEAARDANIAAPLPVKYSAGSIEPGLVGIWRPVLLLPEGIVSRLSPQEMQAILAHELCHFRRRDNLAAALHMIVEALFWFHPLVWWLGARLVEERECACDESVLAKGADPETYARGILKVCQFYLRSPFAAASGVSGADLKKRMDMIMENRAIPRLTPAKKLGLGVAAALVIMVPPLMVGLIPAAQATVEPSALFGNAMSLDAARFDRYVGYYRFADGTTLHVRREGGRYFIQLSTGEPVEITAESGDKFFARALVAQVTFDDDASGVILHQAGRDYRAARIAGPKSSQKDGGVP